MNPANRTQNDPRTSEFINIQPPNIYERREPSTYYAYQNRNRVGNNLPVYPEYPPNPQNYQEYPKSYYDPRDPRNQRDSVIVMRTNSADKRSISSDMYKVINRPAGSESRESQGSKKSMKIQLQKPPFVTTPVKEHTPVGMKLSPKQRSEIPPSQERFNVGNVPTPSMQGYYEYRPDSKMSQYSPSRSQDIPKPYIQVIKEPYRSSEQNVNPLPKPYVQMVKEQPYRQPFGYLPLNNYGPNITEEIRSSEYMKSVSTPIQNSPFSNAGMVRSFVESFNQGFIQTVNPGYTQADAERIFGEDHRLGPQFHYPRPPLRPLSQQRIPTQGLPSHGIPSQVRIPAPQQRPPPRPPSRPPSRPPQAPLKPVYKEDDNWRHKKSLDKLTKAAEVQCQIKPKKSPCCKKDTKHRSISVSTNDVGYKSMKKPLLTITKVLESEIQKEKNQERKRSLLKTPTKVNTGASTEGKRSKTPTKKFSSKPRPRAEKGSQTSMTYLLKSCIKKNEITRKRSARKSRSTSKACGTPPASKEFKRGRSRTGTAESSDNERKSGRNTPKLVSACASSDRPSRKKSLQRKRKKRDEETETNPLHTNTREIQTSKASIPVQPTKKKKKHVLKRSQSSLTDIVQVMASVSSLAIPMKAFKKHDKTEHSNSWNIVSADCTDASLKTIKKENTGTNPIERENIRNASPASSLKNIIKHEIESYKRPFSSNNLSPKRSRSASPRYKKLGNFMRRSSGRTLSPRKSSMNAIGRDPGPVFSSGKSFGARVSSREIRVAREPSTEPTVMPKVTVETLRVPSGSKIEPKVPSGEIVIKQISSGKIVTGETSGSGEKLQKNASKMSSIEKMKKASSCKITAELKAPSLETSPSPKASLTKSPTGSILKLKDQKSTRPERGSPRVSIQETPKKINYTKPKARQITPIKSPKQVKKNSNFETPVRKSKSDSVVTDKKRTSPCIDYACRDSPKRSVSPQSTPSPDKDRHLSEARKKLELMPKSYEKRSVYRCGSLRPESEQPHNWQCFMVHEKLDSPQTDSKIKKIVIDYEPEEKKRKVKTADEIASGVEHELRHLKSQLSELRNQWANFSGGSVIIPKEKKKKKPLKMDSNEWIIL